MIVVAEVPYLLIIYPDHVTSQPLAQVIAKLSSLYPKAFRVGWMKLFLIVCAASVSAALISGRVICGA
jgi:hypothetical protein